MPDSSSPRRIRLPGWRGLVIAFLWVASVAVATKGALFLVEKRTAILRRLGRLERTGVIETNLYALRFERVPIAQDGYYGAITPLGDGLLYSTREGHLWFVDSARQPRPLGIRVPINTAEFDSDPDNAKTVDKTFFAVKDLLVQATPAGLRVFAAHHQWVADQDCNVLRVSMLALPAEDLLAGRAGEWRTLFDSRPCVALGTRDGGEPVPSIGAGGRMEMLTDDELLLTVGTFINDGDLHDDPAPSRRADYDYGKTIVVDLRTLRHRVFSQGHRNPQGLARGEDGRLWSTEHSERGGDELNLLREGADYGYPYVSYGTQYGTVTWPHGAIVGRHEGYERPAYAWVPSIGTSQLVVVKGPRFGRWRGDLLVSSLAARSLYRVRVEGERVVLAEPIPTIHRMRDLAETAAGELVFLAEDGFLVYLTPVDLETADPALPPEQRGQIVAVRCQGCHSFAQGANSGIGPNLHGVLGRRIGGASDFAYSAALRAAEGRWTEESLRRFLADPAAFLPGTSMQLPVRLEAREVDDLLAYLRTVR